MSALRPAPALSPAKARRNNRLHPRLFPDGLVYFIQEGKDGPIKIGITTHTAERRMQGMQVGNPRKLRLLLALIGGGAGLERQIHEAFSHCRMLGEWFRPVPELIEFIDFLGQKTAEKSRIVELEISNRLRAEAEAHLAARDEDRS